MSVVNRCTTDNSAVEEENSDRSQQLDTWGDDIEQKDKINSLRITTVNINGLPKQTSHPKYGILREAITSTHTDIIGLSEINIKWDRIYPTNRLKQRTASWWRNTPHCSYSYNYKDLSQATYQPGGTAILCLNQTSNRILPNSLSDPEGLGRWTSSLLNGKHNLKVRVIQIYCPALPTNTANNSVYAQHQRYFLTKKINECPRKLFFIHLHQFITSRRQANEQVVVMGDFNHAMDNTEIRNFLSTLNLHNILQSLHSTFNFNIPTYDRGSKAIDAIFATPDITATQGGYLEFKKFPTDHRAIWCDISYQEIFGHIPPNIIQPTRRRLQCEDPRVVNQFCETYLHLVEKNDLLNKALKLNNSIKGPLTQNQQKMFESIDKQRVACVLKAEKKCRKFKMGGVEYSPKMQHQRDRISLWTAVMSRKKGNKVSTRLITRLEKRIDVSNSLSYNISQVKSELSDAYQQYKIIKKDGNGSNLRDEWYEQLANAKAEANNTSFASELKKKRQKEKQKRMFKAIKWTISEKIDNTSISELTETRNGEEIRLTSRHEIEEAIIKANDNKYRQTNETPLMSELLPDFGFLGSTQRCKDVLSGDYVPCNPTDEYTRAFIKELAKPPGIPSIPTTYTKEDYITGWKKMKEHTTSGLSGVHFGHHKACATHPILSHFESIMCSIPYASGYAPERYKRSVNAMLLKKVNEKKADKLRTILLLEADFNHLNKKMGKDLMFQAEKFNLIAPEQFGSRKRHSSIDQVLVKRLYYDALRISRTNGFLSSNDAKSCYDRILHSVASISMQRIGMTLAPITCMFTTLQQMQHFIRTGYGLSDKSYGVSLKDGKPVQGSGQGNGASPTIWALISTPLLNMVRTLGFGVSLKAPLTKEETKFVGCSFVDDTDLLQTAPSPSTPLTQCQQNMQQFIDAWSGGLRATGGALVPSKSWIYPIEFVFDRKGNPSYKDPNDMNLQFTVKDSQNERQPLRTIHPSSAKETLGVYLAPDGNEKGQIEYLKNKITKWVEKVRKNHISKIHAYTALTTTIYKTLEYPTPATTISEKQWAKLLAPLYKCGLQANGICSTISKKIREGPRVCMSLQMKCMYKVQEISKMEKYLTFRSQKGILGNMIRLSEELLRIETGLPGNIFSYDYEKYQILATPSWIKSIWQFINKQNILLDMETKEIEGTKKDDLFIMKELVNQGFSNKKLQMLNSCRKFLQVNTLGDISTSDGTTINKKIKCGEILECSTSTMQWPIQSRPDDSVWKLWRSALRKTFECNGQIAPGFVRTQWENNPPRIFKWYYDHLSECLLHLQTNQRWKVYRKSIQRGRQAKHPIFHQQHTELNTLPNHAKPASIIQRNQTQVKFTGTGDNPPPETNNHPATLEDYISSLKPNKQWPFRHIHNAENINHIATSITNGNCLLISDGSFFKESSQSAAAWIMGNEALHRQMKGQVLCAGDKSIHSAYRGELAGIFGGLQCVKAICKIKSIRRGRLTLGCDGLVALKRTMADTTLLSDTNFDYISAIRATIKSLPITIDFLHVKGHVDEITAFQNLTLPERMNVEADSLAKTMNSTTFSSAELSSLDIDGEIGPIIVRIDQRRVKITSNLRNHLYNTLTSSLTQQYWIDKMKIDQELKDSIDWKSMGESFTAISMEKQKEVVKWNSDCCGTAKNLKRWKEQTHQRCPTCGFDGETTDHILKCPHPDSKKTWEKTVGNLDEWLKQQSTAPDLRHIIIENIRAWREERVPVNYEGPIEGLQQAVDKQSAIGWAPFVRGFIHTDWKEIQRKHLQQMKSRRSHRRWVKMLIIKFWQISWDMWRFRNGILHTQDTNSTTNFTFLLTTEILKELEHGHRLLPPSSKYLFSTTQNKILNSPINNKKLWLANVWAARDSYTPADTITQNRNPIVQSYIVAWKKRLK